MDAAELEGRLFIAGDPKVLLSICSNGNKTPKSKDSKEEKKRIIS